ncbi:MAG: hypothetical protein QM734_09710 [Cyclobacteriaceae bacterium]
MAYFSADRTEFPIVKVKFLWANPTLKDFNEFLDYQKQLLEAETEFVLQMDSRVLSYLSSEVRIAQGQFFKTYKAPLNKYCLGAVLLVKSPIVKMMLKAMMLIERPPNTVLVTDSEVEASKMAADILKKQGNLTSNVY